MHARIWHLAAFPTCVLQLLPLVHLVSSPSFASAFRCCCCYFCLLQFGKIVAIDMKAPVRPPAFAFVEFA